MVYIKQIAEFGKIISTIKACYSVFLLTSLAFPTEIYIVALN